ncbi:hypothetical protein PIB30_088398 [Stylosanthes scabra]|uniref:Uncharacterized protein n=1 Tax=Stylosanthes scabra TaxID=79078 RepID=A0ABU6YSI8_9FABA|nr:hypothetical protein [Stylosanthes scabra]
MLKGSFDFLGLNYYTATYVGDRPCQHENLTFLPDICALFSATRDGVLIGSKTATDWLHTYPHGILDLLEYTKENYGDPIIYITENGINEPNDGTKALDDNFRIDFLSQHLSYIEQAIGNGVKVKGYFVWSLLDNFEWSYGYTVRWGIIHVDFKNDLKRFTSRDFDTIIDDPEDAFNSGEVLFPIAVEDKTYCFVSPLLQKTDTKKCKSFFPSFDQYELLVKNDMMVAPFESSSRFQNDPKLGSKKASFIS